MKRKAQIRESKGITLLALVITIVILIILSTIAINMTFGENGLVERAEQAKNMTEEASRKEQEGMANAVAYINEVIYGSGSSSETPSTNEEPAVNEEPIINEVEPDTNTVEPPPVEIPDAEGEIQFGEVTWSGGQASVSISTDSGYEIEYQKNGTGGSWTKHTSGEAISGLNNGDIIYVRLTDGENYGKETSITIIDGTAPQVTVTPGTITSSTIKVEVEAVDNESGMLGEVTYTYYIKKTGEQDAAYVDEGSNTNANYTFTGLDQGTSYDIKVEALGDKAGNKGEGTLSGQSTVSIPGGETGLDEGAIAFGTPTWSEGTASVVVSTNTTGYTIEYQISAGEPTDGSWQEIANNGTVSGINHGDTVYARLTDGTNYGEYASATITDTNDPVVEIAQGEVTSNSIAVTVNATDGESGLADADTYKYYIGEETEARETSTSNTYTFTGLTAETPYSIKVEVIDKAGNVGTQTTSISTTEQKIDAGEISRVPADYYGAEVKGYGCTSDGVSTWRIYYADDTNIYLIADDYISYTNAPDGQNGSEIYKIFTDYTLSFPRVKNDYEGANFISVNSKANKWLNQYLAVNGTSTNDNIKAVAYLMDTNVWSVYAGEDAEYAMGGPTIELFCASYKDTHPTRWIECGNVSTNGYELKWSDDNSYSTAIGGLAQNDFKGIYIKSDANKAHGMWITAPSAEDNYYMLRTDESGFINYELYYTDAGDIPGIRPIVCLKSDVELEKLDDGTFQIKQQPKDATEISQAPAEYYGAEVVNYEAPHAGVDKWRIYYADDSNIYLIADDYITSENAPKGQNGSSVSIIGGSSYKIVFNGSFEDIFNDYPGASWISENSEGSKWLSQFLEVYGESATDNIKEVAYMMDTNVWSAYYAGEYAEYAMGGPTVELFCASYKDTHPSKYVQCNVGGNEAMGSLGYNVKWSDASIYTTSISGLTQDDYNSIYIKSDTSKANGMWLASTSSYLVYMLCLTNDGKVYTNFTNSNSEGQGIRPIVCLKSGVQLQKQSDGSFMIME